MAVRLLPPAAAPLWALVLAAPAQAADANQIVTKALELSRHSEHNVREFAYTQHVIKRSENKVESSETFAVESVEGEPLPRLIARHGKPLSADEAARVRDRYDAAVRERRNESPAARKRRLARYERVVALGKAALPAPAIADAVGVDRRTVRWWLRAGHFPERKPPTRRRRRPLDTFAAYIAQRHDAGLENATALCAELRALGYGGSVGAVRTYLADRRVARPYALELAGTRLAFGWAYAGFSEGLDKCDSAGGHGSSPE